MSAYGLVFASNLVRPGTSLSPLPAGCAVGTRFRSVELAFEGSAIAKSDATAGLPSPRLVAVAAGEEGPNFCCVGDETPWDPESAMVRIIGRLGTSGFWM